MPCTACLWSFQFPLLVLWWSLHFLMYCVELSSYFSQLLCWFLCETAGKGSVGTYCSKRQCDSHESPVGRQHVKLRCCVPLDGVRIWTWQAASQALKLPSLSLHASFSESQMNFLGFLFPPSNYLQFIFQSYLKKTWKHIGLTSLILMVMLSREFESMYLSIRLNEKSLKPYCLKHWN